MSKTLKVEIAGICLKINVEREQLFKYLESVFCDNLSGKRPDLTIDVCKTSVGTRVKMPQLKDGEVPAVNIAKGQDKFFLKVNCSSANAEPNLINGGFMDLRKRHCFLNDYATGLTRILIAPFMQSCLQFVLSEQDGFVLHACGVVKDGSCHIFSGPSGSGKTTIADLSAGLKVLSDDIICVKKHGCEYYAYGTPWRNGDTGGGVAIRRMFFIAHGKKTIVRKLTSASASLEIIKNIINNFLDGKILMKMLCIAEDLSSKIDCYALEVSLKESFWRQVDKIAR